MRVSIIIPAQNEEQAIGLVLDEIPRTGVEDIIVVENGSSDNTALVAEKHGARVIHSAEKGYGNACLTGLRHIREGTDVIVILDADHSDYPEDLIPLLEPILRNEYDFVIGSRVLGNAEKGSLTIPQRVGNAFACLLIHLLYGFRYTDMGPFRAIRVESILKLNMKDRNYGWNAEMQVKALTYGLRVAEIPVRYRKRIGISKISGTLKGVIHAGYKIIATIIRLRSTRVCR